MSGFDPEILNDFLTESGELLEELDADLVELESTPDDPDLLNKVFRALHTIKGSASFLALGPIVRIAHAAEDALNAARRGEVVIDRGIMDLLLEAVDLLKTQFAQLSAGADLTEPSEPLVAQLIAIGEGGAPAATATSKNSAGDSPACADVPPDHAEDNNTPGAGSKPLVLPENKSGLLEFMIADLDESLDDVEIRLTRLANGADTAADDALHIAEVCDALSRSAEFFEHEPMRALIGVLGAGAERLPSLGDDARGQIIPRMAGVLELLRNQAAALHESRIVWFNVETLCGRFADLLVGNALEPAAMIPAGSDAAASLAIDGVSLGETPATPIEPAAAAAPSAVDNPRAAESRNTAAAEPVADSASDQAAQARAAKIEQTIRVEVGRLEELLNLVGELVLQKNRIGALARQTADHDVITQEAREAFAQSTGDLDRVTGDIQLAVMRTRMQPLDKLFGKYPRLIRDLAGKTGKKIALVIDGGETEVDKSVIEELGDPLVHLLRNSADHGLEPPAERIAAGKSETGTIRLVASQAGDHVLVQIIDDGRGLNREKLIAKAIEKGMTTPAEAETLTDREVFRFIFGAGFSTAAQVSDLSGRGVGMDVVRTNIEKLKGSVDVDSTLGRGTTIQIRIPLTVAIMPAMMVGVGRELYAIPLSNIVEIVRPEDAQLSSVNNRRVMRLRDTVLPLVSMSDLFDTPEHAREDSRFAVVIELNEQRAGLMVSRLIGQQEVVIKPLDGGYAGSAPISGATVRDDGGVSLIVDVAKVIAAAQQSHEALAV